MYGLRFNCFYWCPSSSWGSVYLSWSCCYQHLWQFQHLVGVGSTWAWLSIAVTNKMRHNPNELYPQDDFESSDKDDNAWNLTSPTPTMLSLQILLYFSLINPRHEYSSQADGPKKFDWYSGLGLVWLVWNLIFSWHSGIVVQCTFNITWCAHLYELAVDNNGHPCYVCTSVCEN